MEDVKFFTEDSQIVKQQLFLIENGLLDKEDVLPLFNLREVVNDVLSKNDNVVD